MTSSNSAAFCASALSSSRIAGSSRACTASAAAMCMAVGNRRRCSTARDSRRRSGCAPAEVRRSPRWRSCWWRCRCRSGRCRRRTDRRARPSTTSSAACLDRGRDVRGKSPTRVHRAAALLISPSARMNDRGKRSPLIGKFSTARWRLRAVERLRRHAHFAHGVALDPVCPHNSDVTEPKPLPRLHGVFLDVLVRRIRRRADVVERFGVLHAVLLPRLDVARQHRPLDVNVRGRLAQLSPSSGMRIPRSASRLRTAMPLFPPGPCARFTRFTATLRSITPLMSTTRFTNCGPRAK